MSNPTIDFDAAGRYHQMAEAKSRYHHMASPLVENGDVSDKAKTLNEREESVS